MFNVTHGVSRENFLMDVEAFVDCKPNISAVNVQTSSSDVAFNDFFSVISLLVTDSDFAEYTFKEPPHDLSYPFNLIISCNDHIFGTLSVDRADVLMQIPDFILSRNAPALLFSASEEIPRALIQFTGDNEYKLLLLSPEVPRSDLEIINSRNFRSDCDSPSACRRKFLVVQSSAGNFSEMKHRLTMIDFVANQRETSDATGSSLDAWLITDHQKQRDMQIGIGIFISLIALIFFKRISISKNFKYFFTLVSRFLVPLTSVMLMFWKYSGGSCGCCAGGVCGGCK